MAREIYMPTKRANSQIKKGGSSGKKTNYTIEEINEI